MVKNLSCVLVVQLNYHHSFPHKFTGARCFQLSSLLCRRTKSVSKNQINTLETLESARIFSESCRNFITMNFGNVL